MKKRLNSIFIRLLATMLFTAVFINVLFFSLLLVFFRSPEVPSLHERLRAYASYIFADLDSEPTLAHARQIAGRLYLDIRYRDSHTSWATNPNMPTFAEIEKNTKRSAGIYHETPYLLSKNGDRSYLLYGHILFLHPRLPQGFYFVLALILLLFIASYLFIRTIIKPVKQLQKAVEQIKAGNLDIHIPVRRMDELGELSVRFNVMADQIKKMLKAKDQLLLDVSHELRSPLTRMKVAAEFIKDRKLKHTLTEEMDGMEGMISEILETARINSPYGKPNPEEIALQGFLKNIIDSFAGRKPGIVWHAPKNAPVIRADARQLTMLFNNILDNALRYSAHQEKPARVRIQTKEGGVDISVKDYGYGIPNRDLPYIFEPFYRVDSSRSRETGGYGIGFSLSKRIVDAHGGTIEIQSTERRGTTVTIFLPCSPPEPGENS